MRDPDNGEKPSVSGASAAGRTEGQNVPRSGKGKRRRGKPSRGPSANVSLSGTSGEAGRPELKDAIGDEPVRKRKRRRRSKSATAANAGAIGRDVAENAQQPQGGQKNPSPKDHQGRKNRNRRGLQGRPLATAEKPRAAAQVMRANASPAPEPQREWSTERSAGFPPHDRRLHRQPESGASDHGAPLYAALDLGTNNCRLLIAQPTRPGQFRVVDAFSRIVRLGEGLGASGRLSPEAMDRSIEALKICAAKLKSRNIRRSRLIATEAARAAENGESFLERVLEETGLELEIINRETEARLAVSGCSSLVGRETKSVVLFDIGGGSSEIAVIRIGENRSSRLANHITHWTSLPVGVVTLSERHGGQDVTPENFETMVREVEGMLAKFDCPEIHLLDNPGDENGFHLIGTSGTVTTLAGVHLDLPRYDRRKVDGLWLSDNEVSAMQARLLSWDFTARAANPCIGPDRADLVLAGCAILEAIRRRWPSERMRVADRGLREGLLTDMMADDGIWRRGRGRRHPRGGAPLGSREGNAT
ncbi:exopolyphosphatase/guanosine-5'-triphosphate,3'-diphosphate pyrophosphatase [Pararhizobium capsulatum DSM 1112]|uniref:Exopolyphosphatase/guanosine-5'-triphosphate, 3'-diphosphate pyrophosphatase n=1 Tax=Pararhizobium capsulatum DSM 1112 TaxID=1121113 RepID=A0ABU0BQV9_9HYPH|nr:Ppx/GppA phosphatase family protein [Pararhizobium capsulatum]MDQ0319267.1 exopolyphosphatase/guanosine-5'-triphosphate,3'-diphosphate pyrophosphatase [Pararhizobium capsulatum DSM 1112]